MGAGRTPTRTPGSSSRCCSPHRVPTGPGLSPGLTLKVAAATVVMALGLGFFVTGVYHYRARPPAPGEPWGGSGTGGDRDSDPGDTDPPHPLCSLLQVTLPSLETTTPQVTAHRARPRPLSPGGVSPLLHPHFPPRQHLRTPRTVTSWPHRVTVTLGVTPRCQQ